MTGQISKLTLTCALAVGMFARSPQTVAAQDATAPLNLTSATVSISGTSNIHDFTASTTEVRVTRLALAGGVGGPGLLGMVLNAGAIEGFEIAIKAASLSSPKEGLDKNMHKALKVSEFKEITFRLLRIETAPSLRAVGVLKVAGVEREITVDLKTASAPAALTVTGEVKLLMTDFNIAPPKAMLGMLKTDPKITVKFETVFAVATTL
jgi:YceI-like domain